MDDNKSRSKPIRFTEEDLKTLDEEDRSVVEVLEAHRRSYVLVVLTEMVDEDGKHTHNVKMDCNIFEHPDHEDHIALDLLTSCSEVVWKQIHEDKD